jgi:hypothetical protein
VLDVLGGKIKMDIEHNCEDNCPLAGDPVTEIYVGVWLSEEEVMKRFGAKYDEKILDTCPNDNADNSEGDNYCGRCGTHLVEYEKQEGDEGIEELSDLTNPHIEIYSKLSERDLYTVVITKDMIKEDDFLPVREPGIIIGRQLLNEWTYNSNEITTFEAHKINDDLQRAASSKTSIYGSFGEIEGVFNEIGLNDLEVGLHVLTYRRKD